MSSIDFVYTGNFSQWEKYYNGFCEKIANCNARLATDPNRMRIIWENAIVICSGKCLQDEQKEGETDFLLLSQRFKVIKQLFVSYKKHGNIRNAECKFDIGPDTIKVQLNDFYLAEQLLKIIIRNVLNCDINSFPKEEVDTDQYLDQAIGFCEREIEAHGKKVNNPRIIALYTLFEWYQQRGFLFNNENQFMKFVFEEFILKFKLLRTDNTWTWIGGSQIETNQKSGAWNDCRGVLKNYFQKRSNFNVSIQKNNIPIVYYRMDM